MIPHNDGHYHDHDLYHHAPNDDDNDNGRTDVTYDDDKEDSGNNDDQYEDPITGHRRGASKYGSNASPAASVPFPHSTTFLPHRARPQSPSQYRSVPSTATSVPSPHSTPFLLHQA